MHFFLGRIYSAEFLPPYYVVHHYRHDRKTPAPTKMNKQTIVKYDNIILFD